MGCDLKPWTRLAAPQPNGRGYSIGGGAILAEGEIVQENHLYPYHHLTEIMRHCSQQGLSYWEYVEQCEGPEIWDYLSEVLQAMRAATDRGLEAEGVLPGGLGVPRKAAIIRRKILLNGENFLQKGMLPAYALAVAEENAAGGVVVTAPTCGSAGVVPRRTALSARPAALPRPDHAARPGHRRADRQPDKIQRFHLWRSGWLPGRNWRGLRHGLRGRGPRCWAAPFARSNTLPRWGWSTTSA